MGIQGLLTFIKPASKPCHLSDLKGQTVAIDSYCWIHKGAFGCAEKLGKGEDTDAYVQYCFKFIDMLRSFNITPIMVFDGQNLPAKRLTEEKRRENRALAKKRAAECLKLNKRGEARMNFVKAVDVTPEMALKLIKACRKQNIDCIVAPYEADAQLAFLNLSGIVDCIITEDSDLLVFGCKKVLFKLDLYGNGTLVESEKLFLAMEDKPDDFTLDKFRHMCILSGCDYLESLPGVGLKKSLKFIKANSNCDIYDVLPKLPMAVNLKNVTVTKQYMDNFMTADATFRHQLIYDPLKRQIRPLFNPSEHGTKPEYCSNAGDMMDQNNAFQLALGNLSPDDLKVMDDWNPDKELSPYAFKPSIWSKSYQLPDRTKKPITAPNILPTTKNKNVIIDIKIPSILQTKEEMQAIEQREENIKKEIHALYFNTEENPEKKICLHQNSSTEITSPILTRKRGNIFIKSRFFAEKNGDLEFKTDQSSQEEPEEGSDSQSKPSKVQNNDISDGSDEPKSQDLSESEDLEKGTRIRTRSFRFKRKFKRILDSEELEESPISLESLERRSSRTLQKKLGLEVQTPLNDILPEIPVKNPPNNTLIQENLEEEVFSFSQKENEVKICRSRFFSVQSEDNITKKQVSFEQKIEVKSSSMGSQGSKLFSRSQSVDDKLFSLGQKIIVSTKMTSSRRVGLSRKASAPQFTVQKNQPKLTMFFNKKT